MTALLGNVRKSAAAIVDTTWFLIFAFMGVIIGIPWLCALVTEFFWQTPIGAVFGLFVALCVCSIGSSNSSP